MSEPFDLRARLAELRIDAGEAEFYLSIAPLQGLLALGFRAEEVQAIASWRERRWRGPEVQATTETTATRAGDAVAELLDTLENEKHQAEAAIAADLMLPRDLRRPAVKKPRGRHYGQHVVRRHGDKPSPSPWWLRNGTHAMDVERWLRLGWKSQDPVEAEVVKRLRRTFISKNGHVSSEAYMRYFGAYSLAFVLWYAQVETTRKEKGPSAGYYRGYVAGKPRGELARLMGHRSRGGLPVGLRRVTQYLKWLRGWLDGIFEYHQPSQEAVRDRHLPKATHFMSDGEIQVQGYNIYWFRGPAHISPTGPVDPRFAGGAVDPGSSYGQSSESTSGSGTSRAIEGQKVSPPLSGTDVRGPPGPLMGAPKRP